MGERVATAPSGGQAPPGAYASAAATKLWLSERFASETDAQALLAVALETMGRFLQVSRVAYGELDPALEWLIVPQDWTDGSVASKTGRRIFERDSPFARHYRAGRTLIVADAATAALEPAQAASLAKSGIRSLLGVPLVEGGELVAVFNATHTAPRPWSDDEVILFAQTGARIWSALQHLRMLEQLREGEEQFRTLAENMPGLCWLGDANGKPYWGNRRAVAFFAGPGRGRGDMAWVVHPDDHQRVLGAWNAARATGTALELTARIRGADGRYRPFLASGTPIHDAAGQVIRWCGVLVDLSAQYAHDDRQALLRGFADATRDETDPSAILAAMGEITLAHMGVAQITYSEVTRDPARFNVFLARPGRRFDEVPAMFHFAEGCEALLARYRQGRTLVARSYDDDLPELTPAVIAARRGVDMCASITVPLVKDGRLVAMLTASDPEPRSWNADEVQLVEELADRVWSSVSRARAEAALAERERNQSFLVAWTDRLRGEVSPDAIMAATLEALGRHLGITRATYAESDASGRLFHILSEWRDGRVTSIAGTSFSLDDVGAQVEREWLTCAVVRYDDIAADPRVEPGIAPAYLEAGIAAFVSVPLVESGRVRATLSVQHDAARAWREGEMQLLRDVAERTWVMLERARAQAELLERERHQAFLIDWSDAVRSFAEPQAIVETTLGWLGRHLGVARATYAECDAAAQRFTVTGEWREGVDSLLGNSFLLESVGSAVDGAWRAGALVRYDDVESDPRLEASARERYRAGRIRAFVSVPLVQGGDMRAALSVQSVVPRAWGAREVDLLRDIAERLWVALERAQGQAALRARERNQAFLIAWNDAVRQEANPRTILALTLDRLGAFLGASRINYGETDREGSRFDVLHEWRGDGMNSVSGYSFAFADLGERVHAAHASGRPVVVADIGTDPMFDDTNRPLYEAIGMKALLAIPLIRGGRLEATLSIQQAEPRNWSPDEVQLVADVADRTWAVLERARSEERLAASEAQLSAFMENAPVAMHLKDAKGRYLTVNPEFARALRRDRDEFPGTHPDDLFPPEIAREIERLERVARTGEVARAEISLESIREGAHVLAMAFPVSGGIGQARTGGFTLDLTERKAAEAALARSRETLYQTEKLSALGSLLAGVSHELNNPLSIVVAQAVMMERRAAGGELAERAGKIRKAADRCARIVQTFLAMARQKRPERTVTDLNAVVTAAHDLTDYGLKTEGIATVRELAAGLPSIFADADQLHQIVVNLIVNAQQAMVESATADRVLTLRTAPGTTPGTVTLDVIDTGPGVPEPVKRRIFEPFFTTKPQGQGTGVGLSFSQGLAEAHGGRLELVPSAAGACLRLTLPIQAAGEGVAADVLVIAEPEAPVRRALVVDDEREIAESLADFLSLEGFRCDIADGGTAAQAELAHGDYDLIVSDLRMADLDGPQLYTWLARARPDLAGRIGFATGDTLGTSAARFLAEVKRPVLEKPFMPDAVRRFLQQMDLA